MIVTPSQMRTFEQNAIAREGIASLSLMENAGLAVAHHVLELARKAPGLSTKPVLILCGKGNNAGDGMVVARELHRRQWPTHTVFCLGRSFTGDAKTEYDRLMASEAPTFDATDSAWLRCDYGMVLDAIFGTGANKPLPEEICRLLLRVNALPGLKVALDVPTGIHPETGSLLAQHPFEADETLTFHCAKTGLYLSPGRFFSGKVTVLPIGIAHSEEGVSRTLADEELIRRIFPKRVAWGHKGTFGKVGVLGGSIRYRGAPVLSAKAAFMAGCGLVHAFVPAFQAEERPVAYNAETIVHLIPSENGHLSIRQLDRLFSEVNEMDILLIGPGLGRMNETMELVRAVIDRVRLPMVIDADGLYAFGSEDGRTRLREAEKPLVLTPHLGEFAMLLGLPLREVEADALSLAENFAREHRCTLVLKGATTLVAAPEGTVYFNLTGNSGLAVGGSGDVLAGLIAGFLPAFSDSPEHAAVLAAYAMGRAAEAYARNHWEGSLTPTAVLERLPRVLKESEP